MTGTILTDNYPWHVCPGASPGASPRVRTSGELQQLAAPPATAPQRHADAAKAEKHHGPGRWLRYPRALVEEVDMRPAAVHEIGAQVNRPGRDRVGIVKELVGVVEASAWR